MAGSANHGTGLNEGGLAINASPGATFVAVDQTGRNLYFSDTTSRVRRINFATGVVTTVAGNGSYGYSGDGGVATLASFSFPSGIALDRSGNLFVADHVNFRVRRVDAITGVITTVAGNGTQGYSGDGGLALNATMIPLNVRLDAAGNLYICDFDQVRKVSAATGVITTVAGTAGNVYNGDGVAAISATLWYPTDVVFDSVGNFYIADDADQRIRKVTVANGLISTVAGTGECCWSGDGGPAVQAKMNPTGGALDKSGNLFVADGNRIRKVAASTGVITTIAGPISPSVLYEYYGGFSGDGGTAIGASLRGPSAVAVDSKGNVYVADTLNSRIRKIEAQSGNISTVVGSGVLSVVGTCAFGGDGALAVNANLCAPTGVAVDSLDNLYIADAGDLRIRKVTTASGLISTIAGNGISTAAVCKFPSLAACYSGDGGPALRAQLFVLSGVSVDAAGNIYFVDGWKVRRVDAKSGLISTVVGSDGFGYGGDGGPATEATLYKPTSVAVDGAGNIFVTDIIQAAVVRRVDAITGTITTIAGTGPGGTPIEGALASSTQLGNPRGVAVGPQNGAVFVFDFARVFALSPVPSSLSVVNAASNRLGAIAPGEIILLYGSGLGPSQLAQYHIGTSGLVDCQLSATIVQINGTCAPIIYTSSTQVAAIVPYSVSSASAQITVTYQGVPGGTTYLPVSSSVPGIFTLDSSGKGTAACLNQDGSVNTATAPARIGDVLACFATGEGQTAPGGIDGKPATLPLAKPNLPVGISIGGQSANFTYAGGAPGQVAGVMQFNVQIPSGIQTGNAVPLTITVGYFSSRPGVTIAVR